MMTKIADNRRALKRQADEILTTAGVNPTTAQPVIPRPQIEVLERSLQHPFGIPSSPVEFRERGFVTHWVNTELKGGHQFQYYLQHGWLQAKVEYLKHPELVPHTVSLEGYVTRGPRQQEILMYTTEEHYRDRQRAKAQAAAEQMQPHIVKRDTVEAASRHLGDEAATYLQQHTGPVGEVRDQIERIERSDDAA